MGLQMNRESNSESTILELNFELFLVVDGGITPGLPKLHLLYDGLPD